MIRLGIIIIDIVAQEEGMLADHFKDEWKAYAARTRRLVPFLY